MFMGGMPELLKCRLLHMLVWGLISLLGRLVWEVLDMLVLVVLDMLV